MAQWVRGFSGNNHRTLVDDREETLRAAIAAFRRAEATDRDRKAKAVRQAAERLLPARLRAFRARIAELEENVGAAPDGIESLKARERAAASAGVRGILEELDAADICG